MKKTGKILAITVTSVLFFSGMLGVYANGDNGGEPEGCTPGFWKNHQEAWTGFETADIIGDVFGDASGDPASATLLEALSFKGGAGIEGAARILLRTAVAALLNVEHPLINYQFVGDLFGAVNGALSSGDRDIMLDLKDNLDYFNNLGCGVCDD